MGEKETKKKNFKTTMTHAFHLEADNIPVTFPGKCQGLGRFSATKHRKPDGEPSSSPFMPKNSTVTMCGLEKKNEISSEYVFVGFAGQQEVDI